MSRIMRWIVVGLILALPLGAAEAQQRTASVSVSGTAGPRIDGTRIGMQVVQAARMVDAEAPRATPQGPNLRRRGVPQMIIGGAALLGGAIIGDDAGAIISIAGLGVGLWGLYLYLQ